MQYLWDEEGRRYLDGFGGIVTVSVGHCHPAVVSAVQRQNELLQVCSRRYHPSSPSHAAIAHTLILSLCNRDRSTPQQYI